MPARRRRLTVNLHLGSANLNGAESPETTARAETGILALAAAASANPDDASAAAAASATAEGTTTDAAAQSSADAEASIGSTATADASSSIAGGNPVTEIFTFASGQAGSNRAEAGATMGASANASEAGQAATSTGGALGASELSAAKTLGFGQNEFFFGDGTDSTHDFKDGRAVRPARKSTNLSCDARCREVDSHAGAGLLRYGGQSGLRPS